MDRDEHYSSVLDEYDAVAAYYKGWSLTEVRSLTVRERHEWLRRAIRHTQERLAAINQEG